MPKRFVQSILLLLLVSIFGIELSFLVDGSLTLSDVWFSLLLVSPGCCQLFRPSGNLGGARAVLFCWARCPCCFSFVVPDEILIRGGWLGWLGFFFWNACFWLFPFAFVHFFTDFFRFPVNGLIEAQAGSLWCTGSMRCWLCSPIR